MSPVREHAASGGRKDEVVGAPEKTGFVEDREGLGGKRNFVLFVGLHPVSRNGPHPLDEVDIQPASIPDLAEPDSSQDLKPERQFRRGRGVRALDGSEHVNDLAMGCGGYPSMTLTMSTFCASA